METSAPTTNLSGVPTSMQPAVAEYIEIVRQVVGGDAKSLTLYGVVLADSFNADRQTARGVLVVSRVDLDVLRRLAEHGVRLGKLSIAAPLIMTPEYIKASLDTFPLELMEISQRHVVLFGDDHFTDLSFQDGDVRLQCEREIKTVLIGMRQGLLAAAGREQSIAALERNIGEGLMRLLRGMLWLKGAREAKPPGEVLEHVERITERKLDGIRTALDTAARHGWSEFDPLYRDVESLGAIVDGW